MFYDEYILNSKELYHHGILGMKWGVRRYQNKDGSLTDAGKKRYAKQLKKEFRSDNWNRSFPTSGRVTYDANINPKIKSALSKKRRAEVLEAKKIFDKVYDDSELANLEMDHLAEEYSAKRKISYDEALDDVRRDRPDLHRKSNLVMPALHDYLKVCGRVAEDILGKYADMTLYGGPGYSHTLRDDIADKVYTMALVGELDMDRKIR